MHLKGSPDRALDIETVCFSLLSAHFSFLGGDLPPDVWLNIIQTVLCERIADSLPVISELCRNQLLGAERNKFPRFYFVRNASTRIQPVARQVVVPLNICLRTGQIETVRVI